MRLLKALSLTAYLPLYRTVCRPSQKYYDLITRGFGDITIDVNNTSFDKHVGSHAIKYYAHLYNTDHQHYTKDTIDFDNLSWINKASIKLDMTAYLSNPEALRESDKIVSLYWRKYFDVLYDLDQQTPITLLCS